MNPCLHDRPLRLAGAAALSALLAACGGSQEPPSSTPTQAAAATDPARATQAAAAAMTQAEAVRFAHQATFGPNEALIAELKAKGRVAWIQSQMALPASRYTAGSNKPVDSPNGRGPCADGGGDTCWRDTQSLDPLLWDFYRNASFQPDQLRQRVAFALQQLIVVNHTQTADTYGFKRHYNQQIDLAFGNYRDLLRQMALSPVMGKFLNNVNNDKAAPNENFARELLQLFSLGPCLLDGDGKLTGGACKPTYDNATVREYAYALTGWTFATGGLVGWQCGGGSPNCSYYGADMQPYAPYRDTNRRQLLSGVAVPASSNSRAALEAVLDSLMAHPNMPPFIAKRLIEKLVMSNPSAAYVGRVAQAFASGRYSAGGATFGTGQRGDLAATVASVLLDAAAIQGAPNGKSAGHLREPVLMMVGAMRALNGGTDGVGLRWNWDQPLRQMVFMAPSVFNFYPPEFPVAGTDLQGPEFGIHGANSALGRLNYLTAMLLWNNGVAYKDPTVPGATGTYVRKSDFYGMVNDPAALVDRFANLLLGQPLAEPARGKAIDAVAIYRPDQSTVWRESRVGTAAFLVMASPDYQVPR